MPPPSRRRGSTRSSAGLPGPRADPDPDLLSLRSHPVPARREREEEQLLQDYLSRCDAYADSLGQRHRGGGEQHRPDQSGVGQRRGPLRDSTSGTRRETRGATTTCRPSGANVCRSSDDSSNHKMRRHRDRGPRLLGRRRRRDKEDHEARYPRQGRRDDGYLEWPAAAAAVAETAAAAAAAGAAATTTTAAVDSDDGDAAADAASDAAAAAAADENGGDADGGTPRSSQGRPTMPQGHDYGDRHRGCRYTPTATKCPLRTPPYVAGHSSEGERKEPWTTRHCTWQQLRHQ